LRNFVFRKTPGARLWRALGGFAVFTAGLAAAHDRRGQSGGMGTVVASRESRSWP
jgi:hypothetical protein